MIKKIILFILLVSSFFVVYRTHYDFPGIFIDPLTATIVDEEEISYPFPLHNDEWTHLAQALMILEEKRLVRKHPYLGTPHQAKEPGFHVLIAELFSIMGLEPISYQFLPAVFAVINTFCLFAFMRLLTKKYWASLFSGMFFLGMKNNLNLMGNWFFIPLTATLPLVFAFFMLLENTINNGPKNGFKNVFNPSMLLCLVLLASIAIYPISTFLMLIVGLLYILTRWKDVEKFIRPKHLVLLGMVSVIIFLFLIKVYVLRESLEKTVQHFISLVVFKSGWTALEHKYSLTNVYGKVPLALSLIGVLSGLIRFPKRIRLIAAWIIVCGLEVLSFSLFHKTLLIGYQRCFYYLMVGLCFFSGIGLNTLVAGTKHFLKSAKLAAAVSGVVVFLVIYFTFIDYYNVSPKEFSLHLTLSQKDYSAIKWIDENYDNSAVVLAEPFVSTTIYPLSRNRVVGLIASNLPGGNVEELVSFFNTDCKGKTEIMKREDAKLVLSRFKLSCPALKEVYNNGSFVYEFVGA